MERQELYCHNCDNYVRFNVPEQDGRLIVNCPNCQHEHFRVVRDGIITEERWGSNNQPVIYATSVTSASTSFVQSFVTSSSSSSSTANVFIAQSWLNSTTAGG